MKQFLTSILLCLSSLSLALEIETLNPIETLEILPEGFSKSIKYNITLPQNYYTDADKEYFLLFDLHPRSQTYLSGMQDWLSHNGEWPWLKTIIVNPADYHKEFASTFDNLVESPNDQRILDILQNGVLKAVDNKYRTNGYRIYSGFMSNGALGLYTILNRPEIFDAYLIASPTLGNNFANIVLDAPKKLQAQYDGMKFLYMTIGQHNYEQAHLKSFKKFEHELQKLPQGKLDWRSDNNEKHYYMSRPVITVLNGIEILFNDIHQNLSPDSDISKLGPDAIIEHYQMLSKDKYGFEISAEGSLNALADSFAKSNPKRALAIYTKTTALYPSSAYALASLAGAYAEQGQIEKAIEIQQNAVDKSKSMGKWHQNNIQQQLTEFKVMLNALSVNK